MCKLLGHMGWYHRRGYESFGFGFARIEARILAQASSEGISVDEYLQDLVSTNEEFVTAMRRLKASFDPLPPEIVSAKVTRGLEELARGEFVDGETFMHELLSENMDELLSEIENRRGPSPSG